MRRWLALTLGLLTLCVAAQESVDTVPVPLFLDNEYQGDLEAQIDQDGVVRVDPQALLGMLREVLSEELFARSTEVFRSPQPVALQQFNPLGISVSFDLESLALVADVPPLARRTQQLSLTGRQAAVEGTPVAPADISAIANLDLWSRYVYESPMFEASATPELVVRVADVVLETQGGIRTGSEPLFLDHARIVWDIPEIGYRVEAGDLTWRTTELAEVSRLTGVSLVREPSLSASNDLAERVLDRFFLSEDATVEVYINETRQQRRDLSAGNYELSGVPLAEGVNTVLVLWEEADTRLVELVIPYDSELRAPNELDLGVAFAVANRDVLRPVMVAYQQYGVSPQFTIGARQGFEPITLQVDAGLQAVLATTAGTLLFEPEVGVGPQERLVVNVPLRYSFLDTTPSSYLSFGLSATYLLASGAGGVPSAQTVTGTGYVNLALPEGFSVTPRASYRYGLHDGSQDLEVRGTLRRSMRGGSAVSGDIGFAWDGSPRFFATVTFSASFPEAQQNLFLQQNLESQEFSAYWARYAGEEDPALNYSVSARVPTELSRNATLSGQVGYQNNVLQGSLAHGVTGAIETAQFRNSTSLSVQSALVFADQTLAVSRPVASSFALVVPGESIEDEEIRVGRAGNDLDILQTAVAVLPDLSNNSSTGIVVESARVLFGLEEGGLSYAVNSAYRSGSLIVAQPQPSVYVSGTLVDQTGEPIPLEVGTYAGEEGTVSEFFTDERGEFELYGLSPGSYELRMRSVRDHVYRFSIAEDSQSFVALGTLEPSPVANSESSSDVEGETP